jgi:hypothetical protein
MPLDRRAFIKSLLAAAVAPAVLDADELLWIPGAKLISVPAVVSARPAIRDGLTDGERYLCAQMGISELGFVMRRSEMHRKNDQLPAGYFRSDTHRSTTLQGGSTADGVEFVKTLFPERFQVGR